MLTSSTAQSPARRRKIWTENRVGLTMLIPGIGLIIAFMLVPFFYSMWLSMHVEIVGSTLPVRSVGWMFYQHLFNDPIFRGIFLQSLRNNGEFALFVVPIQTGLAMFLAILVNRSGTFVKFCRTTFFLPVVFPMVLTSLIWKAILAPGPDGMLNAVLHAVTFGHFHPQFWLANPHLALPSIIMLSIWQGTGFQMVIFLAGLQGIPSSHYEAALVDGAKKWHLFRDVTLPGLRNTTIFVVIVTTIFSLRVFDQIYLLTQGGPNNSTSSVMYLAVSQAYVQNNVGQGAAISVVLCFVILVLSLIQRQVLKERVD
jgi:multiple sugar transport system permease protein